MARDRTRVRAAYGDRCERLASPQAAWICPGRPRSGPLTTRTFVLLLDVRWLAHPTSHKPSPPSRRAGARPRRDAGVRSCRPSKGRSPSRRRRRRMRSNRVPTRPRRPSRLRPSRPRPSRLPEPRPDPGCPPRTRTAASCPLGSPRWTRSSGPAACRAPPRWRCAGTRPRARPRWRCGSRRRRRPAARSSRGWTLLAPSIPWRRSRVEFDRSGWWCSRRPSSTRRCRWPGRCSSHGPWTCWYWTCRTDETRRWPGSGWGTGWAVWRRWRAGPGRCSWCSSRTAWDGAWRRPSRRRAACGWSSDGRSGSASAATWWASEARRMSHATATAHRDAGRSSRSCTRRVGHGTAASCDRVC